MSAVRNRQVTVVEHLLLHQKQSPAATGKFTQLLYDLILAAKLITRSVTKAGLLDVLGGTGEVNVQGENVQKLDEFANNTVIHRFRSIRQNPPFVHWCYRAKVMFDAAGVILPAVGWTWSRP